MRTVAGFTYASFLDTEFEYAFSVTSQPFVFCMQKMRCFYHSYFKTTQIVLILTILFMFYLNVAVSCLGFITCTPRQV
jgi:hypothetical protein